MNKVRQAVIMVGGKGTRLRPLTDTRPKPILPVLDKPCLMYLIESLARAGISEIILACGYKSEKMAYEIGNGGNLGIDIEYSYENQPMGTAGAIKLLEDRLEDTFVAVNGDVFADINVTKEIEIHRKTRAIVTLALTQVENPCEFGIARTDEGGRILEFKEKPRPEEAFSNLINAGVYVVEKRALSDVPKGQMFDFSKELLPILLNRGERIQSYNLDGMWRDVGRPADLLGANLDMAEKRFKEKVWNGTNLSGSEITKPFYAGKGTTVTNTILNAVIVLEESFIRDSILKRSMVMKNCSIDSAEISGSILGEGCMVHSGAVIIDSVLGDGTVIEQNVRMEGNEIL
jgi:mannose-1-phosphate guanylyltransferase